MSKKRWSEIKAILSRALDLSSKDREIFLLEACSGDAELLREVHAFLQYEVDDDTLLEIPILDLIAGRPPEYRSGQIIGVYRLVGEIARGGMGVVYRAERVEGGFEQTVAVKVLKRGFDTGDFVRRFRAEQQILSDLDHPHITRLLDGGATEDGLPYLVMEHVDGTRLDKHLLDTEPDLDLRLEIFLKICDAVHAAHQHMVVHCDLKPSNVLVTAEHEPKLLDFGIAKVLHQGPEATQSLSLRLGTPQYVSPEQTRGGKITTGSDVFSLGGLLFLMLTETSPTAIREPDQATELPSRACRKIHPERAERIRGDLDAVVLKARAFDPSERYASVAGLAEDLRRHLAGLTVSARPYSWHYALRRFLRRRRRETLVAGFMLLLIAFGAWSRMQSRWSEAWAREVREAYMEMLEVFDPTASESRAEAFREAMAKLRDSEPFSRPEDQARLYDQMGRQMYRLDRWEEAETLHRRALELRRSTSDSLGVAASSNQLALVLSAKGEIREAARLLYRAHDLFSVAAQSDQEKKAPFYDILHNLAGIERELGRPEAAERLYRQALEERIRFHGAVSMPVARTTHNLGLLLLRGHRLEEAEVYIERSLEIRKKILRDPHHPHIAQAQMSRAILREAQGRLGEALELHRVVLESRRQVFEDSDLQVARSRSALAFTLLGRSEPQDLEEARRLLESALDAHLQSADAGPDHQSTWVVQRNLADALLASGRPAEAESLLRPLLGQDDRWSGSNRWRAADVRSLLGAVLTAQGRIEEAAPLFEGAWELISQDKGPESRYAREARARLLRWQEKAGRSGDS